MKNPSNENYKTDKSGKEEKERKEDLFSVPFFSWQVEGLAATIFLLVGGGRRLVLALRGVLDVLHELMVLERLVLGVGVERRVGHALRGLRHLALLSLSSRMEKGKNKSKRKIGLEEPRPETN